MCSKEWKEKSIKHHNINYGVVPHFYMLSFKFRRGVRDVYIKIRGKGENELYCSSSGTEVMIILQ